MNKIVMAGLIGFAFCSDALSQTAAPSCPGDKVVWVNTSSHVYHYQGERYFGRTKYGVFMCEKAAQAEGDRPTRNGQ